MDDVQLLIAGAGFAGLCCARAAASRGVDTLVLERQAPSRRKVATTGIVVKEVADAWDLPHAYTRKIHGVRLYSPSLNALDFSSPGYYFLATDTPALLRWLERQARDAGANIAHRTTFKGCSKAAGDPRTAVVRTPERDDTVRFDFLMGCDGAHSQVARSFSLGRNRKFLSGVELEFEGVIGLDEDFLHVFVDANLATGYIAWVVPGVGITQVGLAVRQPAIPCTEDFMNRISRLFDFSKAKVIDRRAGVIPCGGVVEPIWRNNVMVVGDAAGMVSPLTGGGIHSAMGIGRAAGVAVSDYLLEGQTRRLASLTRNAPSFLFKRILRSGFDLPIPNLVFERLLENRVFRAAAQNVFFHHRGLLSLHAWKDMLWNDAGRETLLG
ncbi:MAG: NAD(P)/FAD-dependent oxidoreductase [Gammaproteobacteria bacterium]